jgi:phage gp36-like protein
VPVATVYCTLDDMERKFSSSGVVEFADHDDDGTADTGVVDDAIQQATEEINLYAMQHYSAAGLASSSLINRWCTVLAVAFLCLNRGNPIPVAIQAEYERIMLNLERVRTGEMRLPGVAYRDDTRPTISNLEVDRRYRHNPIRVNGNSSTDAPSVVRRNMVEDYLP